MWRTTWSVGIIAGVVFLGGAGCAQSSRGGVEPVSEAPPVHVPSAPVGETVSPSALALSGDEVVEFQAMGEESGRLRAERVAAADGARWIVTERAEMDGDPARERELTLRVAEDGSIVMSREVNRGERVVVVFEPPLVVYPARLALGETFEQRVRMTVHPISNPDRVQAEGDVTQRITWEGRESITLPMGEVECVKLTAIFEADLGGPQVVNESQEWLAEGMGVVAMKKMERTTLLGVRVRANNEWWGRVGGR